MKIILFVFFFFSIALNAQKKLSTEEKESLEQLVKKYFETSNFKLKQDILRQTAQYDPITSSDAQWFSQYVLQFLQIGPKLQDSGKGILSRDEILKLYEGLPEFPEGANDGEEGIFYVVGGKKKQKQPLLIGLHGGGAGEGDGQSAASQWSGASGKGCICIFPTVTNKTNVAWNSEREELYVLELIERAKRTFMIDTNRIYMVGHSMGGFGTWSIGSNHADKFASLSANAGGVPIELSERWVERGFLPNLFDTPIFYFHSVDDERVPYDQLVPVDNLMKQLEKEFSKWKLYKHQFQSYTNIGHGFPSDWNTNRILEWVLKYKRDPYPSYVIWEPRRAYKQVFYNLYLKSPDTFYDKRNAPRIIEEIKNKSEIELTIEHMLTNFYVLLSPKQIDFKKPLVIKKNGEKVFEGIPEYSAWAILVSLGQNRDPEQYYLGRVKIPD